jgi:arylsulfatase A-like enzyme
LVNAFKGADLARSKPIFFEHEGNRAVRQGKWKLVAKGEEGKWELYDIESDRSEMHDLASAQPARAQEMANTWQQWAQSSHVLPLNPWKKKPKT